jgi:hypothetical protein
MVSGGPLECELCDQNEKKTQSKMESTKSSQNTISQNAENEKE